MPNKLVQMNGRKKCRRDNKKSGRVCTDVFLSETSMYEQRQRFRENGNKKRTLSFNISERNIKSQKRAEIARANNEERSLGKLVIHKTD